jgi:uncharacterized membrane protein
VLAPQRAFLWLAPAFGLALGALTPPLHGPDENRHLNRAYMIAHGDFWATTRSGIRGNEIPWSVLRMQRRLGPEVAFNADVRQDPARWAAEFTVPLAPADVVFASMPSVHSPLPYFPQSLAVALSAGFEPPPVVLSYAARIANLSLWVVAVFFALSLAPSHRWSLFLLTTSPMALFIAATASADVTTNALAFVWIAWILRLRAERTRVSGRVAIGLTALSTGLGLSKLVYWALTGLLLLIPVESFDSSGRRLARLAAIALASLIPTLAMFRLASGITELDPVFADADAQWALLRSEPLVFANVLWDSARSEGLGWIQQFVGVLGWLDTVLPVYVYPLWVAAFAGVVALESPTPGGLGRFERALLWAIPLAVWLAVLFNGFIRWTAPDESVVRSFQGRYLIPVVPLIAIACQRRSATGLPVWAQRTSIAVSAGTLLVAVASVATRYHLQG